MTVTKSIATLIAAGGLMLATPAMAHRDHGHHSHHGHTSHVAHEDDYYCDHHSAWHYHGHHGYHYAYDHHGEYRVHYSERREVRKRRQAPSTRVQVRLNGLF